MALTGLSTAAIGALPTYAAIGVAAPVLLVLLRVLQGVAIGGEWGGAVLVAVEYAPPGRRGLYGSTPQIGLGLGLALGTGAFALLGAVMDDAAFAAYGWRIAFLASVVLVVIGFVTPVVLVVFLALPRARAALALYAKPRPKEKPEAWPAFVWPLYFVRMAFAPHRRFGMLFLGGLAAARGRLVVIGDADASYDFSEIPRYVAKLREGYDVVVGNRFKGGIRPGAMPWHHRLIGNPLLTGLLNLFFGSSIGDAHCGMRALTSEAYREMKGQGFGPWVCTSANDYVTQYVLSYRRGLRFPIATSGPGSKPPPLLKTSRGPGVSVASTPSTGS